MQGTSKVIMGATLVMVVSLAIVLGLILVLLAELYCSLLLRRRQHRLNPPSAPSTATSTPPSSFHPLTSEPHSTSPLTSFYSQGVLHAPRSFLFPSLPSKFEPNNNRSHQIHHLINIESNFKANPSQPIEEIPTQENSRISNEEHLVYISNPIYDNDGNTQNRVELDTPFETPDSSPSRLETETGGSSSSSGEEEIDQEISSDTPPMTPMKKLPAEACSVSLRDARCLGTSGSDSNSKVGHSSSTSSSGSPCTSPSW